MAKVKKRNEESAGHYYNMQIISGYCININVNGAGAHMIGSETDIKLYSVMKKMKLFQALQQKIPLCCSKHTNFTNGAM